MNTKSEAFEATINELVRWALVGGLSVTEVSDALKSTSNSVWRMHDLFGLCPICHKTDGHANVGRRHVFYCKEHKTSWCIGSNLLSSWREQTEEEQHRIWNEVGLDEFEDVEPYLYPRGDRKPNFEDSEPPF
jgi:hypothetical protein